MNNKWAIFILGPTGVGKTSTAIAIAEVLDTEIISADSRQVYRELQIGTAVPSEEQQKKVRHHLLQHRSIKDYYNACIFEEEAIKTLEYLFGRYRAVLIEGGSGLYVQAITSGIDDIPAVDPEIRENLLMRMAEEGIESLRFELKKLDPASYDIIDLRNPKRILKALEICLTTGKTYSGFLTHEKKKREFNSLKIGLDIERSQLYRRINHRVDEMLAEGLLEEAESLLEYRGLNALKTVGYREIFDYLDGKYSLEEAAQLIKRNSRHYARRQLTWFKRDPEITWFSPEQTDEIISFVRHATR